MNRTFILLLAALIVACDYGVEWRDEPYEVHWIDVSSHRQLAYDLGDGGSIGRVKAEVIAVGSNKRYVVAKQRELDGSNISFYYIERDKDDKYYNWYEITKGPFSEEAFLELKKQLGLPEFSKEFKSANK